MRCKICDWAPGPRLASIYGSELVGITQRTSQEYDPVTETYGCNLCRASDENIPVDEGEVPLLDAEFDDA